MSMLINSENMDAALMGGLILSAGGSGERKAEGNRALAQMALITGPLILKRLDELKDDAQIIVATGVSAPGFGAGHAGPEDSVESARMLLQHTGFKRPAGVMPAHVPGVLAWVQAAVLGLPLIDAATNGRGHPTLMLGSMSSPGDDPVSICQAGCGGAGDSRITVLATGPLSMTAAVMRAASVQNRGTLHATRGPYSVAFVRHGGAPGAVSRAMTIGRTWLDAPSGMPQIEAVAELLGGEVVALGRVARCDVTYRNGYDIGRVAIWDGGNELELNACNEWMTAAYGGFRIATFPDLICTFDPESGKPLAVSEMAVDRPVAVVRCASTALPVGAGARDPAALAEVSELMGVSMQA